jgi:hypothetical protein
MRLSGSCTLNTDAKKEDKKTSNPIVKGGDTLSTLC